MKCKWLTYLDIDFLIAGNTSHNIESGSACIFEHTFFFVPRVKALSDFYKHHKSKLLTSWTFDCWWQLVSLFLCFEHAMNHITCHCLPSSCFELSATNLAHAAKNFRLDNALSYIRLSFSFSCR